MYFVKKNQNKIILTLLALFSFFVNFYYANLGVNPMDNFVLYNGGYKILNGFIPFKDYWLITGPLLDYLNALFFLIGGISWKTYIIHSSFFNTLITLSTYFFLTELKLNKNYAFFYSLLFSLMMYPVVGTPFVDHHSTIFLIISFYLVILAIKKNNYFIISFTPFLLSLSFLSKQTPSVYGILVLFIIFIIFIIFNQDKTKIIIKYLLFGSLTMFIFLGFFLYFTDIPIKNFILQYMLYPQTIGQNRLSDFSFNFSTIIIQYKFINFFIIFLIFFLIKMFRNFKKDKNNIFLLLIILSLSFLLIYHQMLTSNEVYIFFLIPLLASMVHLFYGNFLRKNKIMLYISIFICIYAVGKYHLRFNEHRKFNELEKVNLEKAVEASQLHQSLSGLKWISSSYPDNPLDEINDLKEAMNIIKNDKDKFSLLTTYQFIAPALMINDNSPNQWHHPSVSFPIKGNKYFLDYKNFFIENINSNKIMKIYTIGIEPKGLLGLIIKPECFKRTKVGNIIYKHELIKNCEDFQ